MEELNLTDLVPPLKMMLLILLVEFLHLILRQHLPCFWDNLFKLRPLRRGLVWITDVASTDVTEETEEIVLVGGLVRSEEHTSELQSLMRISYAVFCLKKQTDTTQNSLPNTTNNTQNRTAKTYKA